MRTNNLLFLAALFVLVACSQAQLIWVRPSDGTPCPAGCAVCNGTFACPVASIQDALNLLPWGGTIRLFSGTYSINNPAITSGSFTILGNVTTVIDCGGAPGFRVFNGNAQFIDFVITGCSRPGGNGGGFNIQGAYASFSRVNTFANTAARGAGIYVENGSVTLFDPSNVFDNRATDTGGGMFLTSASANLGPNVHVQQNFPNDIRCVMSSFNGGTVDVSSCLNCGACTTP